MQKLDIYGNLIHSSFSSNDPHAAALTPQRIQQSRRDSQRLREMASDYFDPQFEEEFYSEYSAPPPAPPPVQGRGNPRGPIYPRGPVVSGGYHPRGRGAGYPLSQEQYDPVAHAYSGEDYSRESAHFESMNHHEIEKVIRTAKPWSGYHEPFPYHPPAPPPSSYPRYSYPGDAHYQAAYPDYYPPQGEGGMSSYHDEYPPHHAMFITHAQPPHAPSVSTRGSRSGSSPTDLHKGHPMSSADPTPPPRPGSRDSHDSSPHGGGSPKSRSSSLSKPDWNTHPLSAQAQHVSEEGQLFNYQPAYTR
jgi:hypothetical protein